MAWAENGSKRRRVGFIGGGNMAEAIISGLLSTIPADCITVSNPGAKRREYLAEKYKVNTVESNLDVFPGSDAVILCVKPQVLDSMLKHLKENLKEESLECLFISVIAGQPLAKFESYLPTARVARVMPNTCFMASCGAAAYVLSSKCKPEDGAIVETIMGASGVVEKVAKEELLDAVTGMSGSGPAYVYLMIEAMADGGVRMGLPRPIALKLAAQTVMGAGKMVAESGKHPGELKDAVTSPGGTTIAGVHALEAGAFRGTVMNAVEAASRRSTEHGRLGDHNV
eukprot:gnl/TRDRNA2_/TRDRNA2_152730_c1_seq8.p1 gnl/TRDRNA2_/TRDRNA2_152730_c1~~gnl/TRDRNA2_/TRDRNA2_152730_c1_seq8.p1  ORF type:complete len:305 (-),score=53.72 gnl/TRDRNA2_/TRDRNA2_152730_c1_seq8:77-928(-)